MTYTLQASMGPVVLSKLFGNRPQVSTAKIDNAKTVQKESVEFPSTSCMTHQHLLFSIYHTSFTINNALIFPISN